MKKNYDAYKVFLPEFPVFGFLWIEADMSSWIDIASQVTKPYVITQISQ